MTSATEPRDLPPGVWQTLLPHAFALVDEIAQRGIPAPFWTLAAARS
jgi:hypothetical protein